MVTPALADTQCFVSDNGAVLRFEDVSPDVFDGQWRKAEFEAPGQPPRACLYKLEGNDHDMFGCPGSAPAYMHEIEGGLVYRSVTYHSRQTCPPAAAAPARAGPPN